MTRDRMHAAGCRIAEPGGGAGDESDRMSHGWFRGVGGRSNREFQHVGAGYLAYFEPFGTLMGRMVGRKEF
jgi:hypothetical protein